MTIIKLKGSFKLEGTKAMKSLESLFQPKKSEKKKKNKSKNRLCACALGEEKEGLMRKIGRWAASIAKEKDYFLQTLYKRRSL